MDRRVLEILCCPVTKRPVEPLSRTDLERLNARIREGRVYYADDSLVEEPLTEALITDNRARLYRVDDGIPVMLEERSVPGHHLEASAPGEEAGSRPAE